MRIIICTWLDLFGVSFWFRFPRGAGLKWYLLWRLRHGLAAGLAPLRGGIAPCLQAACSSLIQWFIQHTLSFVTRSFSGPEKLRKQLQGLYILGVTEMLGTDFRRNGFTRWRSTQSRRFVAVTVLHKKVSFSKPNPTLQPAPCAPLTPYTCPRTEGWAGEAAHPCPASRTPRRIRVPKVGQRCWGGCPWVSETRLGSTIRTYRKPMSPRRLGCLQRHVYVQATELCPHFHQMEWPSLKVAWSSLVWGRTPPDKAVGPA